MVVIDMTFGIDAMKLEQPRNGKRPLAPPRMPDLGKTSKPPLPRPSRSSSPRTGARNSAPRRGRPRDGYQRPPPPQSSTTMGLVQHLSAFEALERTGCGQDAARRQREAEDLLIQLTYNMRFDIKRRRHVEPLLEAAE